MNTGVILGQRNEDYIAGASPVPFEERNPSGDWTPYLPANERQRSRYVDSMACVSFSALNCVEIQAKLYGQELNLSDRWLAKMSGTTTEGNYLWRVGDTLRKAGGVPEMFWPAPKDFTWESYYADIPLNVRNEGLKLLDTWDIKYEWLPDTNRETLKHHLKQSPLQVVIPGHAVTLILSGDEVDSYYDHYDPFVKTYANPFQAAMKYIVTPKTKRMTESEVLGLQALEGYSDTEGAKYWTGKPLSDYLKARLPDKEAELKKALDTLKSV